MDIERLEPLPEDWERALCVVAHPDDMEFGAAAAVARWTGQGKQVTYCMVTSGEAGIDGLRARRVPRRCARPSRSSPRGSSACPTVEFLGPARRHPGVRRTAAARDRRRRTPATGPTS